MFISKMWFLILLLWSFKSFWLLWNWIGDQKFGLIPLDTELFPNRNRVGGSFTIWQFDKLFKGSFDGGSAINILVSFKWVGEYIHLQFVQVHFWIATITFRINKIQFTVKRQMHLTWRRHLTFLYLSNELSATFICVPFNAIPTVICS